MESVFIYAVKVVGLVTSPIRIREVLAGDPAPVSGRRFTPIAVLVRVPTNRIIPNDGHITVGWGRDYADVSPTNGFIVGGGSHNVGVSVDVSSVEASVSGG